jgi:hypothetical protein
MFTWRGSSVKLRDVYRDAEYQPIWRGSGASPRPDRRALRTLRLTDDE